MIDRHDIQRAEGRIRLATDRLMAKYPFHAAVLGRMHPTPDTKIDTMAVMMSGEAVLLLHNPIFVLGLPITQLGGVLLHEVHHVLFRHLVMDPKLFPVRAALIIAQELTVNEWVHEPLPGSPVLLKDYPELPARESTQKRYDRLKGKILPTQVVRTIDDHDVWQGGGQAQEEALAQLIEDAATEAGGMPQELRDALHGLGIGSVAGDDAEAIERGKGHIDWRQQLGRYVGQVLETRPVFNRPPRRFPDLVGILPGRRRQVATPKVMAVIDTSGSITPQLLTQIDGELSMLATHFEVLVVECDCAIQRSYTYRRLTDVYGRGGTDLRPPLEKAFLRHHKPDLAIYFTDGYGPAPEHKPPVPVVWCLTPDGKEPARWGKKIYMGLPGNRKR
ncbi:MAG TPA: VWA-like domain-containing protein [Gemmataceae bacterium]|jgi:predicted metal-dependent peptidase